MFHVPVAPKSQKISGVGGYCEGLSVGIPIYEELLLILYSARDLKFFKAL